MHDLAFETPLLAENTSGPSINTPAFLFLHPSFGQLTASPHSERMCFYYDLMLGRLRVLTGPFQTCGSMRVCMQMSLAKGKSLSTVRNSCKPLEYSSLS